MGCVGSDPAHQWARANGAIEHGNQAGKGIPHACLALGSHLHGAESVPRPVCVCLVEHASGAAAERTAGPVGDPFVVCERLFGQPIREEALKCEECLWRWPPRAAIRTVLMGPRWRAGVWLGRAWGLPIRLVYNAVGAQVHRARVVQRRPIPE